MAEVPARGPEDSYESPDQVVTSADAEKVTTRYSTWDKQDLYVKNTKFTGPKK